MVKKLKEATKEKLSTLTKMTQKRELLNLVEGCHKKTTNRNLGGKINVPLKVWAVEMANLISARTRR